MDLTAGIFVVYPSISEFFGWVKIIVNLRNLCENDVPTGRIGCINLIAKIQQTKIAVTKL